MADEVTVQGQAPEGDTSKSNGKEKKRTWYAAKPMKGNDIFALAMSVALFLGTLALSAFVNHGKFWNPFV